MPVPASLQLSAAAAIPETWLTAYQLMHFVGKAQQGETVLIHAGGSGVGTAAVQLSRLAGLRALVTAGSEGKLATARDLGADSGFNYKAGNFSEWVAEQTKGELQILDTYAVEIGSHAHVTRLFFSDSNENVRCYD